MTTTEPTPRKASCACGRVELEAAGPPITSVVCYCDDCAEGSRRIEALPHAGAVRDADGGTAYVVYGKDRVRCIAGSSLLRAYKLRDGSATSRVVATCCNSAMYVAFDDGKDWVDVYRARLRGDAPPVQMRLSTKSRAGGGGLLRDAPGESKYSVAFVARLLSARVERDGGTLFR